MLIRFVLYVVGMVYNMFMYIYFEYLNDIVCIYVFIFNGRKIFSMYIKCLVSCFIKFDLWG